MLGINNGLTSINAHKYFGEKLTVEKLICTINFLTRLTGLVFIRKATIVKLKNKSH